MYKSPYDDDQQILTNTLNLYFHIAYDQWIL